MKMTLPENRYEVFSRYQYLHLLAERHISETKGKAVELSSGNDLHTRMTKAELLYGAEKSRMRKENLDRVSEFLLSFQIQGFADPEVHAYASIRSELERKGKECQ